MTGFRFNLVRPQTKRGSADGLKSALTRTPITAAVDLGAHKVACFIMKSDAGRNGGGDLTTAGVGYVQSRGVKAGGIVDMQAAAQSIARAVERAENIANLSVQGVTVAISGGQLASHRLTAQISLGGRPIVEQDCSRTISQALNNVRLPGRKVIHLLPIAWSVDGQRSVRDPRSMFGRTLSLDLLVVSMDEAIYQTLGLCVERAHLSFEGVVAAPYASALAALEQDEMDLGAVCIDLGCSSTSVAVYSGGSLIHVDSLAVGSGHVTQDIARGISTSAAGAERIKTLHGSAIASANEDHEMIDAPPRGDDPGAGPVIVARSLLKGIIAPRVEETLELIRDRLKVAGVPLESGAGLVLTGGGSQLAGVREVAVRVFDRPVRLGRPRRIPHLADAASGPAFCAAAGVLHRAAFGPREIDITRLATGGRLRRDLIDPHISPLAKAAHWLNENF